MIIVHTENEELIVELMHEAFKEYMNPPSWKQSVMLKKR